MTLTCPSSKWSMTHCGIQLIGARDDTEKKGSRRGVAAICTCYCVSCRQGMCNCEHVRVCAHAHARVCNSCMSCPSCMSCMSWVFLYVMYVMLVVYLTSVLSVCYVCCVCSECHVCYACCVLACCDAMLLAYVCVVYVYVFVDVCVCVMHVCVHLYTEIHAAFKALDLWANKPSSSSV